MIKIQFADLEGIQAYYCNIGEERLTLDNDLAEDKALKIIKKIEKDRPTHSQPVSA